MSENRITLYATVASIGDSSADNYHPGYARLQLTRERIQRISDLSYEANRLDVSEIRDAAHGPFVEWFGGDGDDADCVEMVVGLETVYWTALPPGSGAPFQTPEVPIDTLVTWAAGQESELCEIAVVEEGEHETLEDIKAMYQDHRDEQNATLSM